jgi:tetratricopeptide (TPR) repeat protein
VKQLLLLAWSLLIVPESRASGTPVVEFTVGVNSNLHTAANKALLEKIGLIVQWEENNFVPYVDSVNISSANYIEAFTSDRQLPLDFYLEAIVRDEGGRNVHLQLIEANKKSRHYIAIDPSNTAQLQRAFFLLFRNRSDNTIYRVDDAIDFNLTLGNKDVLYMKGLSRFARQDYRQAVLYLDSAIHKQPLDHKSFYVLALCYKRMGKLEAYKRSLDKAIALSDGVGNYGIEMGNYHLHQNDPLQAIGYYRRFAQDPKYHDLAAWNLHVAYTRLRQEDSAVAALLKIGPDSKFYPDAQGVIEGYRQKARVAGLTKQAANARTQSRIKTLKITIQSVAILGFVGLLGYMFYKGRKEKVDFLTQKKEAIGLLISILTFLMASFGNLLGLFGS